MLEFQLSSGLTESQKIQNPKKRCLSYNISIYKCHHIEKIHTNLAI